MREYEPILDNAERALSRLDSGIECLIIGLLAFMPLAFGAVHAWSEEVVVLLAGAIVICFLLRIAFFGAPGMIWSWAYVPLMLFVLIAVFQLVPLPVDVINLLSPNTAALKTELLGDLPNADQVLEPMTLSFYPHATERDLRLVLALAGVFVVVLNVFRCPDQIKRLLMAITIIGGVVAVITLAQNIFGNGKIYWFVPTRYGGAHSGPFVNHSNFGQFMNLSIGAALGLLCVKLHEIFAGRKSTPAGIVEFLTSRAARSLWLLVIVMGLCVAAVFISLTRGGVISMLAAIMFTTVLFTSRQSLRNHGWLMIVMALIAFICILYVGFDAVYDRLASLRDLDKAESGRLQILKDIWVMWTGFPIFGTGLGTHIVVYPMFDRSMITALAAHAENEYAQVAEETGILGLGLLIIFGIVVWVNFARNIRHSHSSIRLASYGLGFGILAILVHSLSDFGQHLPANSVLSAIFCAILLVLARPGGETRQHYASRIGRGVAAFPAYVLLVGAFAIWIWAIVGSDKARVAQAHWEKARDIRDSLAGGNWQGSEQEYAELISSAAAASEREPKNIVYRHCLNAYRWHSVGKVTYPDTGGIVISEDAMPTVLNIVDELHKSRAICPTYGQTYSLVGQIERFVLNDNSGAERIRKGFRLAPCNPPACFLAGYLDFIEGQHEDCIEKLERAVKLDGSLFRRVADIYANHLSRPNLAISAAGDDIGRLGYVAGILEDMQYNDLAEQTRERIEGLLKASCSQPDAPASAFISLGNIYKKKQDDEAAISCYRRALTLNYGQVQWRLELARMLAKAGRIPEAMQEARTCLQLRPQLKAAEKLIEDLSVNPTMFDKDLKSS